MKRRGFLAILAAMLPLPLIAKSAKLKPTTEPFDPSKVIKHNIKFVHQTGKSKMTGVLSINGIEPDERGDFTLCLHEKNSRNNGIYYIRGPYCLYGCGDPNGATFLNCQNGDHYFNEEDDSVWVYTGRGRGWVRLALRPLPEGSIFRAKEG